MGRGSRGYVSRSENTDLLRRKIELSVQNDKLRAALAEEQEKVRVLESELENLQAQLREALSATG